MGVPPNPSRDSPSPSSSPPTSFSGSNHGGFKQHRVALSLLLKFEGKEDFKELVRCVEGLKDVWPDVAEKRGSLRFMKHFFYEVGGHNIDPSYLALSVGIMGGEHDLCSAYPWL